MLKLAYGVTSHTRLEPAHGPASSVELVEETLLQAVDEALLVPGEIVRTAIYDRIERSYQVRREEIPEKLETFHRGLQGLLGAAGKVMEKLIVKNLYRRLGLSFENYEGWTIVDYLNIAKESAAGH